MVAAGIASGRRRRTRPGCLRSLRHEFREGRLQIGVVQLFARWLLWGVFARWFLGVEGGPALLA